MSILSKLTARKHAIDSISPVAALEKDIAAAVAAAERRGVPPHAIVSVLEAAENAERYRMAAGLRF